jgi:hypothetical protein
MARPTSGNEIESGHDEQGDKPKRRHKHDEALQRPPLGHRSTLHASLQQRRVAA